MNDFLKSLKSDLLDRRLIPVLGLLAVVLVAAVVYAVVAGGSSEPATSAASTATPVVKAPGISVSEVKTADVTANAETTSGSSQQTGGASRNPFAPLPGVKQTPAAEATSDSKAASAEGGGSSAASEPSSSSDGGTSSPTEETKSSTKPKATKPKATQTVYHVAVLFGTAAPGSTTQSSPLTPFENLKRQQPLPSGSQPLVVFRGVLAGGKGAAFTLVGEAILRGDGKCLPNATQCQAIELRPGQTEELEYTPPGGLAVNYKLQVVSIDSSKADASVARRSFHGESKTGIALLHKAGLESLPGLRYSAAKGVLVFAGGHSYAARTPAFAASTPVSAWGIPLKG
jgi:hypothetical protein